VSSASAALSSESATISGQSAPQPLLRTTGESDARPVGRGGRQILRRELADEPGRAEEDEIEVAHPRDLNDRGVLPRQVEPVGVEVIEAGVVLGSHDLSLSGA